MGQIGAVGGSGLVSSMTIGYELGNLLGVILQEKGELSIDDCEGCEKKILKSEIYRWLKKEQSTAKAMREILYSNTDINHIDEIWDKFKYVIETRGA